MYENKNRRSFSTSPPSLTHLFSFLFTFFIFLCWRRHRLAFLLRSLGVRSLSDPYRSASQSASTSIVDYPKNFSRFFAKVYPSLSLFLLLLLLLNLFLNWFTFFFFHSNASTLTSAHTKSCALSSGEIKWRIYSSRCLPTSFFLETRPFWTNSLADLPVEFWLLALCELQAIAMVTATHTAEYVTWNPQNTLQHRRRRCVY